jgi:hypothetical protein
LIFVEFVDDHCFDVDGFKEVEEEFAVYHDFLCFEGDDFGAGWRDIICVGISVFAADAGVRSIS